MENNKKIKLLYIIGSIVVISIILFVNLNNNTSLKNKILKREGQKIETFLENDDNSLEKTVLTEKDIHEKKEELDLINENMNNVHLNESPNVINYNNSLYYLFDDSLLMPLKTEQWKQYDIKKENDNYNNLSEFYLNTEDQSNWSQKLTIHRINTVQTNCFDIADKIVNGLIINISDQLTIDGDELTKNNISFNYVKKADNDTMVFWSLKNIKDKEDETQFVRVFVSQYSKKVYLSTYTLKENSSNISNDEIKYYFKVLSSIQELRKK